MKNFWFVLCVCFSYVIPAFAAPKQSVDGFYIGIDPEKIDTRAANPNNAISSDSKVKEDRYYGYKFSNEGFFVSPEVFMQNGINISNPQASFALPQRNNAAQNSSAPTVPGATGVTYNVKANVGYQFNHDVAGFVTYDVGSFAYSPNQRSLVVGAGALNSNSVAIGSQVNISNSFGVKFSYGQQQFENSAVSGGRVRSDVVKVGTIYSF